MAFYDMKDREGERFGFAISHPVADRYDEPDDDYAIPEDCWALGLPHQCDTWAIAMSPDKAVVITEAKRFRAELDQAIAELEASE